MPFKDPEKRKEYSKKYMKEHYQNNKEYFKEQHKEHYQNNKEHIKEQQKEYNQTEAGIKSNRINTWKYNGMSLDYDFNIIYDIYVSTNLCDYCNVELVEGGKRCSRTKCLDHHHITGEIRGILCHTCNLRDVLA